MRAISLLFHDVIVNDTYEESGFSGAHAARYKLDLGEFELHLKRIAKARTFSPILVSELSRVNDTVLPMLLTFDDGGSSAYYCIAEALERYGWHGHFFVTANFIDRHGFLTKDQIRALMKKGHLIGTHSYSHPERMSYLTWDEMLDEWKRSVQILEDITGEPVSIGSVPGGYFSARVAEAASVCGIKALFTSEPTIRPYQVNGCLVLGRFTLLRGTAPQVSGKLAAGSLIVRCRYWVMWNMKKIVKALLGKWYLRLQKFLLKRMASSNSLK
jgi:peptidoglycan/xylan/chitin deacetylase (PgdA/CDA1 family)